MAFFLYSFIFFVTAIHETTLPHEDHAVYLSTMELALVEGEVNMVIKVFEDDLRDALRGYHGHVIDTSGISFDQEVAAYMNHHISFDYGHEELAFKCTRVVLVGDSYQVTMETFSEILDAELSISADYFMELFPTQQNVLHLVDGDTQKYHIFKKGGKSFSYQP